MSMLEWPSNSPDLNLVENLWSIVKVKVAYKESASATENLWSIVKVKVAYKESASATENLWSIVKVKVDYKESASATENRRQRVEDIWVIEITQEYCESLVSSMPRRIQAVIDCNEDILNTER